MAEPFHIFICYAREDREALESLRKKLTPLKQSGLAHIWYDGEIIGGKDWDAEIRRNLQSADLVLLLISDDFFDSAYIDRVELREALAANARQENIVVPVILHDCIWRVHRELAKLQALPDEAKPIFMEDHWKKPELGFANVAHGVVKILDDTDTETRRGRKNTRFEAESARLAADLAAEAQRAKEAAAKEEAQRAKEADQRAKEAAAKEAAAKEAAQRAKEAAAKEAEQKRKQEEEARKKGLPDMVLVKGGTFQMGKKGVAEPVHAVTLSDFEIGKTQVTVEQYMAFVNDTKMHHPEWLEAGSNYNIQSGKDDHYKKLGAALQDPKHPIVGISWDDATAYCNWLSTLSGGQKRYRLPTEAEWEFAARGGTQSKGFQYAGSNDLTEVGWFSENSDSKTHPVGQKKANELGLHDMSGNVWEWCSDWYGTYPSGAQTNPKGPEFGWDRVIRGGPWNYGAGDCRASNRNGYSPRFRDNSGLGFRLASSPQ